MGVENKAAHGAVASPPRSGPKTAEGDVEVVSATVTRDREPLPFHLLLRPFLCCPGSLALRPPLCRARGSNSLCRGHPHCLRHPRACCALLTGLSPRPVSEAPFNRIPSRSTALGRRMGGCGGDAANPGVTQRGQQDSFPCIATAISDPGWPFAGRFIITPFALMPE